MAGKKQIPLHTHPDLGVIPRFFLLSASPLGMVATRKVVTPVLDRVTLSRTLVPSLPSGYLSRPHLFSLFGGTQAGLALLIAPAGYGKTSLVAEWAQKSDSKVIWFTADPRDSVQDIANHMVQAVRNVLPDYAPWYEESPEMSLDEVVRKGSNELFVLGERLIFVVDNAHHLVGEVQAVGQLFIDSLPDTSKIVIIRRTAPMTSFSKHSSANQLSLIMSQDLLFNGEEINTVLENFGVDDPDSIHQKSIMATTHGWPAAVQMLARNALQGRNIEDLSSSLASKSDPLRFLSVETLSSLDECDKIRILSLSILEEVDAKIADHLLATDDSFQFLMRLAKEGIFFTPTSDPIRRYRFNPLIREVLQDELGRDRKKKTLLHDRAAQYLRAKGDITEALEQAKSAEDEEMVAAIFNENARAMAKTGRGDLLIKWSQYAGDASASGQLLKKSALMQGYLVSGDFKKALILSEELTQEMGNATGMQALEQVISMVKTFANFASGKFDELESQAKPAIETSPQESGLSRAEKIATFRVLANKAFIFDDYHPLAKIYFAAKLLDMPDGDLDSYHHLSAIRSLVLFDQGRFLEAYDVAQSVVATAEANNFVGILAPLDAMFVMARCEIEFCNNDQARITLSRICELSRQWSQWAWYFIAEGKIMLLDLEDGEIETSFRAMQESREFARTHLHTSGVDLIQDIIELGMRYVVRDNARCDVLIARLPKIRSVEHIRASLEYRKGPSKVVKYVEKLPEGTPRDDLYKALFDTFMHIDQETVALSHLRRAIDIAAQHGARGTMLCQGPRVLQLIIKAASNQPTVYLESLSRMAADCLSQGGGIRRAMTDPLTARELEVLRNLSSGLAINAIAANLHVSRNTMKTHLRHVYQKLDVDSRESAVEKAKTLFLL